MMWWPLAFWLLALAVCALPFLPAVHEWRARTDAAPLVVVRAQDTNIRHFALSFFDQVTAFFDREGVDPMAPPPPFTADFYPGQPCYCVGNEHLPHWSADEIRSRLVRKIVVAPGNLTLESGLVFENEIYCGGQLSAGPDSTYRAVYAGTDMVLGARSTVARWLHSQGHASIGADSVIYGRVSSSSSITLASGTRFERLNAGVIRFAADGVARAPSNTAVPAATPWPLPQALRALDMFTHACDGDLAIPAAHAVASALVVHGTLDIGPGCVVARGAKARRRLVVQAGSVVRGALVCDGPIEIGPGCLVKGPVVSETAIRIAGGSIIGGPGLQTSVTAPQIRIAPGCQVSGTLWASSSGEVEAPQSATESRDLFHSAGR